MKERATNNLIDVLLMLMQLRGLIRILAVFLLVGGTPEVWAKQRYVYLQDCTLKESPNLSLQLDWPMICLRFRSGVDSYFDTHAAMNNFWAPWAESNAQIYFFNFLGLHHKASIFSMYRFYDDQVVIFDRDVEETLLTLGNPVLHKFRITGGLGSVPFGVDQDLRPQALRRLEPDNLFYNDRLFGTLVFDDFYTLKVNASVFEDKEVFSRNKQKEKAKENEKETGADADHTPLEGGLSRDRPMFRSQFVLRLVHRMSVLDATSFIASLGGDEAGERRVSLALTNVARESGEVSLELVRKTPNVRLFDSDGVRIEQLFRLAYRSPFRSGSRINVMFEETRGLSRLALLKVDLALSNEQFLISPTVYLDRDLATGGGYRVRLLFSLQMGV